jgi:hypothetical protein
MRKFKFRAIILNHLKVLWVSFLVLSLSATLFHDISQAQSDPAYVVSTNPVNGSIGISVNLKSVSVTFSKAMSSNCSYSVNSSAWVSGAPTWSNGNKTMTITNTSESPLPSGLTLIFNLRDLKDTDGSPLAHPGFQLGTYEFSFTLGTVPGDPPIVVSTSPANGAINVSKDLEAVSITFNRSMNGGYSINSNFPSYTVSWSADKTRCVLSRIDLSTPLLPGATYFFNLNKDGSTSFQDLSGIPLQEYSFSFTTITNYQLLKIPENPAKGFHWPYYLSIPRELGSPTILLVEPNNTGGVSDDWNVHDQAALNLVKWRSSFAVDLDVPLLVPTFPRPVGTYTYPPLWLIYTHALDRDSLTTDAVLPMGSIKRIDLQLIAMIRDAQDRLKSMGHVLDNKIFINGYSASGSFANRFTLLHPEIIKACASGSPGGWPTVPVSSWKNEALNYPVGIADLASLVGKSFDLQALRRVPQYIYVGDIDSNDAVDFSDGFDDVDREIIDRLFGDGSPYIAERWPHAEAIFNSVHCNARFVIYPGVSHTITPEMFKDLRKFFASHKHGETKTLPGVLMLLLDD